MVEYLVWTRFLESGRWSAWCHDNHTCPSRFAAEDRMADLLTGWGDAAGRMELVCLPVGERPDALPREFIEYDLGGEG